LGHEQAGQSHLAGQRSPQGLVDSGLATVFDQVRPHVDVLVQASPHLGSQRGANVVRAHDVLALAATGLGAPERVGSATTAVPGMTLSPRWLRANVSTCTTCSPDSSTDLPTTVPPRSITSDR